MDSRTAEFLSRAMLEDDEDDVVLFAFPNQKKKIKCSISMLAEISVVFEAMFSSRWSKEKTDGVDDIQADSVAPASQDKTVHLSDDVNFDQYSTFKLLIQILYGLRQMDSLSVDQATNIFYYAHKYEIKDAEEKIQNFLNKRMESGISELPLSVTELTGYLEFAQMYRLDEFKNKLDQVKLAFDKENPIQFWHLAVKYEMKDLQQQVVDRMMSVAPDKDWPLELFIMVTRSLQSFRGKVRDIREAKCGCGHQVNPTIYTSHCNYCRAQRTIPFGTLFDTSSS